MKNSRESLQDKIEAISQWDKVTKKESRGKRKARENEEIKLDDQFRTSNSPIIDVVDEKSKNILNK